MATVDLPRAKIRGERCALIFVPDLPSDILHQFRGEIMNKSSADDRASVRTAENYESNVRVFMDYLVNQRDNSPLEAETSDLRQFLRYRRREGDADNTLMTRRSAVSRFYGELPVMAEDGVIDLRPEECPPNPEEGFDTSWTVRETQLEAESGEEVHYLEPDAIGRLVDSVPPPRVRNRLIVRLLYQTGLRVSELCNIRLERDLNRKTREINIPAATSKGGSRTVAFKPTLDPLLARWVDGGLRDAVPYAQESEYLFPTNKSVKISRELIHVIVRKAADSADLNHAIYTDNDGRVRTKVSPHILRHSMAVNSLKAGTLNVRELQELLGHSSLEMTEKYLKIASEDATDKYHARGGPPE